MQLLNYGVKLSDHIHWQQRADYLTLIKNFVDLEINGQQFVKKFNELYRSNQKIVKMFKTDIEQLNILEPNSKCFGFSEWISEISLGCDEFYPDFEPQDKIDFAFARDEDDLRMFVADIVPRIEKFF